MAHSKFEHAQRLFRALEARQAELEANEAAIAKAKFRSESLRAAIAELKTTIAKLLSDPAAEVGASDEQRALELDPQPGIAKADGSILARVESYVNAAPRILEANDIATDLGLRIDVVRTSLSKLHARRQIQRLEAGQYTSLQHARDVASGEAKRRPR